MSYIIMRNSEVVLKLVTKEATDEVIRSLKELFPDHKYEVIEIAPIPEGN